MDPTLIGHQCAHRQLPSRPLKLTVFAGVQIFEVSNSERYNRDYECTVPAETVQSKMAVLMYSALHRTAADIPESTSSCRQPRHQTEIVNRPIQGPGPV